MPSVPRLTTFEETTRVPGAPSLPMPAEAADFGGITATQNARAGAALASAGDAASDITAAMVQKEDTAIVLATEAKLKEYTAAQLAQAREMKGGDALGITKRLSDEWDRKNSEFEASLTSERQKLLYRNRTVNVRLAFTNALSGHEAQERSQHLRDSVEADIKNSINLAAANPTDLSLNFTQKATVVKAIEVLGKANGWSRQQIDAVVTDKLTELHTQVIQQLAVVDPSKAQEYYRRFESEIAGARRAELGSFAEKATAVYNGDTAAGEIWRKLGPANDTDPIQLDVMVEEARKTFSAPSQQATRDAAIRALQERATVFAASRKERLGGIEASINSDIATRKLLSVNQLLKDPRFAQLDGDTQRKLSSFLAREQEHAMNMALLSESRRIQLEQRRERELQLSTAPQMLAMLNPNALLRYTEQDLVNMVPALGVQNTSKLIEEHRKLNKERATLLSQQVQYETFVAVGAELGLDLNKAKKSPADALRIIQAKEAVDTAIGQAALSKGKPLTAEEVTKVTYDVLADKVKHGRIWGTEEPYALLSPTQRKRAYVEHKDLTLTHPITGEEVKIPSGYVWYAEIPPSDEADIVAYLKEQGIARPTKQMIGEMYVLRREYARLKAGDAKKPSAPTDW